MRLSFAYCTSMPFFKQPRQTSPVNAWCHGQGKYSTEASLLAPIGDDSTWGIVGTGFTIGLVLGPIFGGSFAENSHVINVPILAVICAGWEIILPPLFVSKQTTFHAWVDINWLCWILHCGSFLVFFSPLIFSSSHWPWVLYSAIVAWVFASSYFHVRGAAAYMHDASGRPVNITSSQQMR